MEQINFGVLLMTQIIFTVIMGLIVTTLVIRRGKTFGQGQEEATFETLQLANRTLPYLRQGLNRVTAEKTAELIYNNTHAAAVAIATTDTVLAFVGSGSAVEPDTTPVNLALCKEVIRQGRTRVGQNVHELEPLYNTPGGPVNSVVTTPLKLQKHPVACLCLFYNEQSPLTAGKIKIASSLAQLMSTQMELSELDRKTERLAKAELQALQMQISPHFVYNTLNTIASFIRTRPETARELIIQFADFTRRTFKKHGEFSTLTEELEYVHLYLAFEKARFGERLSVVYRIEPEILPTVVPVLILQPLVENAVRHGIGKKVGNGKVTIVAEDQGEECVISVGDDGVGMTQEQLRESLRRRSGPQYGVGLSNVNERLKSIYGPDHELQIESSPGVGTRITFRLPKFKPGINVH
ncbi:MAG TPA: histidine kinase [Chloroflexia bacterium]|nr:histidine kinase [Chloroflexia bacterium]